MKTTTWNAAAPALEAVQVTHDNAADVITWLRDHGAHVIEPSGEPGGSLFWFTDDHGQPRSLLVGDWVCLDPQRKTFRLVDEHVLPQLYVRA